MTVTPRYRVEDGRTCIDIRLGTVQQLFDGRDPAPFRERDLDPDAVEYLLDAAQEIHHKDKLRIALTFTEAEAKYTPDDIATSLRAHLRHMQIQLARRGRQHRRRGGLFAVLGSGVLVLFVTLAQLTAKLPAGTLREVLREGLVITGWVAMWRPIETLLYDWWPLFDARRRIDRLLVADVAITRGASPRVIVPPQAETSISSAP